MSLVYATLTSPRKSCPVRATHGEGRGYVVAVTGSTWYSRRLSDSYGIYTEHLNY